MPSFFRSSRRPLPTRSLVLGCALLSAVALGACKTEQLHPGEDVGIIDKRWIGSVDPVHRDVDILFLIDDSSDMALAQDNLIRNFPTFMATLQADPAGVPNLHVAVVSQDMGAGDGSISGCDATGGKQGVFQYTPRGTCSASHLDAGATFISNVGGVANYTGSIEDVFGCIAALGDTGCGFEHQFAAIQRALGVDGLGSPPAENQDFFRLDAAFAIVMLTNEDDCSASLGPGPNDRIPLFDTTSNMTMASLLGPPTNFRCNEFGHSCSGAGLDQMPPNRTAPNENVNASVAYDQCASNDAEGYLLSSLDTANRIKSLKPDSSRMVVASIQGAPTPYTVHWNNPLAADTSCGAASCPWPAITHACTASDGRYGDPGIRTAQFVQEFGINGLQLSVCDSSFASGLDRVAMLINRVLGPACIPGPIGLNSVGQPDCKVTENYGGFGPPVPSCADTGGVPPCWRLQTDATCPGQVLTVSPDPHGPTSGRTLYSYDCAK